MNYTRGKEILTVSKLKADQILIYTDEHKGDILVRFKGCWDDDIKKKAASTDAEPKDRLRGLMAAMMNCPAMGGEAFHVEFLDENEKPTGKTERFTEMDMMGIRPFFKDDNQKMFGQFYLAIKKKKK